ncbi:MAG: SDR family oxidoreductase [Deltaproteobacteria bacterium]|nr:SDR family oxidoreductase [Deltaproteobacteria bacterium]
MKRFTQKRMVITGAGSGLGRELALLFAGQGWKIAVTDIELETAEETLALVKKTGGDGMAVSCDVTQYEELTNLAAVVKKEWGGVDIMVNNAGVAVGGNMEEQPIEDWQWILNINLMGVIHGCKAFIPLLRQQKNSHIINIASAAGLCSTPSMSSYNTSKAGVVGLSETLKSELKQYNIGVTVVCPTFFTTNLVENSKLYGNHEKQEYADLSSDEKLSAEDVARRTYKAVRKNKLYCVPMLIGRIAWRLKRYLPGLYFLIMATQARPNKN